MKLPVFPRYRIPAARVSFRLPSNAPLYAELRYLRPDPIPFTSLEVQQVYADFGKKTRYRVGRQMMDLGSTRMISTRPCGGKGVVFDGLRITTNGNRVTADFLALKHEPYHRPAAGQEYLYGVFTTWKPAKQQNIDFYFLNKYQQRAAFDGSLKLTRAAGMRYLGNTGNFTYEAEGIHEWGFDGSRR